MGRYTSRLGKKAEETRARLPSLSLSPRVPPQIALDALQALASDAEEVTDALREGGDERTRREGDVLLGVGEGGREEGREEGREGGKGREQGQGRGRERG